MSRPAVLIPTLLICLVMGTSAMAQDAAAGETVFKKCAACHQIGAGAKNKSGPVLNGLIGRVAGTFEGFRYGKDLVAAGEKGLVWNQELIVTYIADPKSFLRSYNDDSSAKSKMSFRLKDEQQRLDVAAFLASASALDGAAKETGDAPVETRSVDEVIADQEFTEVFLNDPANVEAGKSMWDGQCALCHGAKAYPGKAPKIKARKSKPKFVFKRMYKGFKGMPNWRETFTIDQMRMIVAYIKSPGFSP